MSTLLDDLRFSLRSLGRTPGFTITASLVLALGIALNIGVFTVANALLLKPLGGLGQLLLDARRPPGTRARFPRGRRAGRRAARRHRE